MANDADTRNNLVVPTSAAEDHTLITSVATISNNPILAISNAASSQSNRPSKREIELQ